MLQLPTFLLRLLKRFGYSDWVDEYLWGQFFKGAQDMSYKFQRLRECSLSPTEVRLAFYYDEDSSGEPTVSITDNNSHPINFGRGPC